MERNSNYHASIAISRLAVAIEYLAWAQQSETKAEEIKWRSEAMHQIDIATTWIDKDMPF